MNGNSSRQCLRKHQRDRVGAFSAVLRHDKKPEQ
jgi:hypothetical protein